VRLWHEALAEPTLADALLDRVVHNAHRIELRGDSLRRRHPDGQPDATDAATGAAAAAADGASRA
jgi:hypothetical protein